MIYTCARCGKTDNSDTNYGLGEDVICERCWEITRLHRFAKAYHQDAHSDHKRNYMLHVINESRALLGEGPVTRESTIEEMTTIREEVRNRRVVVITVMDMTTSQLNDFKTKTQFDETLILDWMAKHATGPDDYVHLPKVDIILPIEEK